MSYNNGALPTNPKVGDLCVWHCPQVGAVGNFHYPVPDIKAASLLIDVLASYDLWQYENNVKGDYANATGLCVYTGKVFEDESGWEEWQDANGCDLSELLSMEDRNIVATICELERLRDIFQQGQEAGFKTPWLDVTTPSDTPALNYGKFPFYFFAEGKSARKHIEQSLPNFFTDTCGIPLVWARIAEALGADPGKWETRRQASESSYRAVVARLIDSEPMQRSRYIGHALTYWDQEDQYLIHHAIHHGIEWVSTKDSFLTYADLETAAVDWQASLASDRPKLYKRSVLAHALEDADVTHVRNLYVLFSGVKLFRE